MNISDSEDAVKEVSQKVTDLGYGCWKTSVGGHGVLQHLSLDSHHFTLPESFQKLLHHETAATK